MKRYSFTMVAAVTVCSVVVSSAFTSMASTAQALGARADAPGGTWGTAQEVPGAAQLNQGGFAMLNSVSCGSVGNCSAGGYYTDGSHYQQALAWPAASRAAAHRRGPLPPCGQPRTRPLAVPAVTHPR
jgi:hypothetical protein